MSTTTEMTAPETQPDSAPDSSSLLARIPGFGPPRTRLPSMTARPDPDPDPDGHQHQDQDHGAAAAADASKSSTASIPAFFRQRATSYAKIAGTLLKAAGGWANQATDPDSAAFLPDDDDLATIPPPLGRLAARRIKIGADPEQLSDVEDIGMAVVGLIVWGAKGLTALYEARRERRKLEDGKAVYREGDQQQ